MPVQANLVQSISGKVTNAKNESNVILVLFVECLNKLTHFGLEQFRPTLFIGADGWEKNYLFISAR
jgi:hypothetical protein